MQLGQAEAVGRRARATAWFGRLARFGTAVRYAGHRPGELLVVGPEGDEPWHLTAHLEDLARYRGVPELTPTLVRWQPPPGRSPGIAIDELAAGGRDRTVLVVSEGAATAPLLERLEAARRRGSTVFGLAGSGTDSDLEQVAHETCRVGEEPVKGTPFVVDFDVAGHLVGIAACARPPSSRFGLLTGWMRRAG